MTIQPYIDEKFNGAIWRLEIDDLTDTLFTEIRDEVEKKVFFSAVNMSNGHVLFKDITTPERWLTGMEAAYDGVLLIHFYQSDSGPAHKGLMAVDAATGKTLWSNYSYSFDHLSVKGPVLHDARIQPRKLFLADIKTGATTRIYEPSVYPEFRNSVIAPEMISPEDLHLKGLHFHPFGNMVHYLEYNNSRIVSLHALKGGELTQSLFIMDGVNKVYEDLLNAGIQKIQPEAFIVHKNRLIYIKNKTQLKVLTL